MDPALRAAASGMMAQQRRTEVISNNLANVNTPGFKRSRAHFEDLLYQTVQGQQVQGDPDMQTAPAIQVGRGTRLAGVQRLHQQGPLEDTGRSMDVAIEGEGFYQIQLPDGSTAYTRDGSFQVDSQGRLVESGLRLTGVRLDERGAWEIELANGVVVKLGRQAVTDRLERFIHLASPLVAKRLAEIKYVDMRYTNGFSVGWNARSALAVAPQEDATPDA